MSKFAKGDLVKLRSGGPVMTVADTGDYGPLGPKQGVKCVWFDKTKRFEDLFDEATLEKSAPPRTVGVVGTRRA